MQRSALLLGVLVAYLPAADSTPHHWHPSAAARFLDPREAGGLFMTAAAAFAALALADSQ
jgi:hypothetical protein